MACRGSAVRIRLAPLIESLPLEGFSSFWGSRYALSHACLGCFLGRFRAKNLWANRFADALLSFALAIKGRIKQRMSFYFS